MSDYSPFSLIVTDHGLRIHAENDDGISVIDVTEPDHPAYCFLLDEDILDASGYLKPYDPVIGYRSFLPRGRTVDVGEDDTESESESQDGEYFLNDMRPANIET